MGGLFAVGVLAALGAAGAAAAATVAQRRRATEAASGSVAQPLVAGRYRLVRDIGRGATGIVYLADDLRDGSTVALKMLALGGTLGGVDREDARRRFAREAEAIRPLRHPDIVAVHDAGEDADRVFLAMELLAGTTLVAYTRAGALLPADTVLRIAARVARALDHAHRHGIVHRDVKPANVMWDAATDTVKVTDFGVASLADAERTRTGVLLGTPVYMSPEQMRGGRIDGRSDLFSLGVVLHQLLTGALPYRDGSTADLLRQIADAPPPDLRRARPDLPDALADVVAIALQKPPALRYPDGAAFADDLLAVASRWTAGGPPEAR